MAKMLLHDATNLGFAEAQYALGTRYYNGIGLRKGRIEGIMWLLKAAGQKHEKAYAALMQYIELGGKEVQNALGMYARRGNLVAQDVISHLKDKQAIEAITYP